MVSRRIRRGEASEFSAEQPSRTRIRCGMFFTAALFSCVSCNPELQAGIFTSQFLPILGMIVSQFVVVGGLVSLLHRLR